MISNILKVWVGGFVIYLLVSFILPSDRQFKDATVYVNIPNNNAQSKIHKDTLYLILDNKHKKSFYHQLHEWQKNGKYNQVLIIVPRLEFFIYYTYFYENNLSSAESKKYFNKSFKMAAHTTSWNIKNLIYYYHQTIFEGGVFIYNLIMSCLS